MAAKLVAVVIYKLSMAVLGTLGILSTLYARRESAQFHSLYCNV